MTTTLNSLPSLDDFNGWADFWYYQIGVNVIPADTRNKRVFVKWSEYQTKSISEEQFNEWKATGEFAKGIAITAGTVWRGEHAGKYFVFIDCDNLKAIEEFCIINGKTASLKEVIGEQFIVEQHTDDTRRAHIYFYSEIPFVGKSSDVNVVGFQKIKDNEVPAFEIKSNSNTIAYCTPSFHKNGYPYEIIGTTNPITLNPTQANELMQHLDSICRKYGLQYLENADNGSNGKSITPIEDLFKEGYQVPEGHNRHEALLRAMESLIKRNSTIFSREEIKELAYKWNQKHCRPHLDDTEFEKQWQHATRFVERKNRQEGEKGNENKRIQYESKSEKIERLTKTLEQHYNFASVIHKSSEGSARSNEPLYYYNHKKGIYEPAEALVKARLEEIEPTVITETVTNVIQKLGRRYQHDREDFDADINVWNLTNGLYNIEKNELQPHNSDYLSMKQLPIRYDKNAKPKRFGKFLSEVLYPQQIRTVVELMAYTFHRTNLFELYVVLLGNGANGKSVLMHVLTKLHGDENVSNTSLNALVSNRFAAEDLVGKNVNIDMELSNATITDMAMLKKLTGQQPIHIERKNMDAYDTLLHAKLFFSTNEMPEISDFSDGHYRREVVVSFPNQFEEGKNANINLKYELTSEEELSSIFNVLMATLRNRILKDKRVYVDTKTINERRLKHELASNPIKAFFEDAVAPDSSEYDSVGKEEIYEAYVKFSKCHKLPTYNYQTFCKLLKQKIPSYQLREGRKGTGGDRKLVWEGVRLCKWTNTDPLQDVLNVA